MFRVVSRYEYFAGEAQNDTTVRYVKKFTNWFVPLRGDNFETKKDAEEYIKHIKKTISNSIDKSTKLKHEYRVEEIK